MSCGTGSISDWQTTLPTPGSDAGLSLMPKAQLSTFDWHAAPEMNQLDCSWLSLGEVGGNLHEAVFPIELTFDSASL